MFLIVIFFLGEIILILVQSILCISIPWGNSLNHKFLSPSYFVLVDLMRRYKERKILISHSHDYDMLNKEP